MNKRIFILVLLALVACGSRLQAQEVDPNGIPYLPVNDNFSEWTPYDTTVKPSCGDYMYPKEFDPCPCLKIKQKDSLRHEHGDHTAQPRYADRGWDTALTRAQHEIEITCTPYLVVQKFNGQYTVDTIGWHPDDTTFHWGTLLENTDDDIFCDWQPLEADFPFYFFGKKKTGFVAGGNGIITFAQAAANQHCDYGTFHKLPWYESSGGGSSTVANPNLYPNVAHHRDAIYGVFQDTDLSSNVNSNAPDYQGIWYGVRPKDRKKPCRRIIASYNDLPFFSASSNANNRQKYQIVCYEGTNVIEIYVARRAPATSVWCKSGFIGIQNATGTAQHPDQNNPLGPEGLIQDGAWPAYWPREFNKTDSAGNIGMTQIGTDNNHPVRAWRFTPHGHTETVEGWYRINPDGTNDTLRIVGDPRIGENDCYAYLMQSKDPDYATYTDDQYCPTLNRAIIRGLTEPTKFVFFMNFKNANDSMYRMTDTIFIGVDNDSTIYLHGSPDALDDTVYTVCESNIEDLHFDFSALNDTTNTSWKVWRRSDGQDIELNVDDVLTVGNIEVVDSLDIKRIPVHLKETLPDVGMRQNKVDSLYLQVSAKFSNGSRNYAICWVCIYPEFDTTVKVTKCRGQEYYWDGKDSIYTHTTRDSAHLRSVPQCDSIVTLDLTFIEVYTKTEKVTDCLPYTWRNGETYDKSTVVSMRVQNDNDCDSLVTLEFQYYPLKAVIHSDLDHFDYDHPTAELQDVSEGSGSRLWKMPDGSERTDMQIYYTIPREEDSALFTLIAKSPNPLTCIDTTTLVLPYNKETLYMPNAFTPNSTHEGNLFSSQSTNTLTEEMFIYNRRGELIYQCEGVDCTWDGRDLNGTLCPQGVYVYLIRYTDTFEPDRVHVKRGTVTLIR